MNAAMASQPFPPRHGMGDLPVFDDKELLSVFTSADAKYGPVYKFYGGPGKHKYTAVLDGNLKVGWLWRCESLRPAQEPACQEGETMFICFVPWRERVGAVRYMAMHAPKGTDSVALLLRDGKKIFGSKEKILQHGSHKWMSWNETGSCWHDMGRWNTTVLDGPESLAAETSSAAQTSTPYLGRLIRRLAEHNWQR